DVADKCWSELFVSDLTHALHRSVVIEDHALVSGMRLTASTQHVLGHLMSGVGAFQLAGGDRFLNERIDHVPGAVRCVVGNRLWAANAPAGVLVHVFDAA